MEHKTNDLILGELVEERTQILDRINELKKELETIQKIIDKRAQLNFIEKPKIAQTQIRPVRPSVAMLDIFNRDRTRLYSPPQLRDELEYLRKQNLLLSGANNLLYIVHSILRNLEKKKVIIKEVNNGITYYGLRSH